MKFPRLDLPGDGTGHQRDSPLRSAPAAPRAQGPNPRREISTIGSPRDGTGHPRDPPPRSAPAVPREQGPNHPAPLLPGPAQVNGAREGSEPVEEPAQRGEIGVTGEKVVGASLERREHLQRPTAAVAGLHPPSGIAQRS